MSGGPPQQELFDYKPELVKRNMQPCPDSLLKNARFAFIKGHPNMLGTPYKFKQHGKSGAWVSELLPGIGSKMDDIGRSTRWSPINSITPRPNSSSSPAVPTPAVRRWAPGSLTASAPKPPTCRASSSSSPAVPTRPAGLLQFRLPAFGRSRGAVPLRRRADPLRQRPAGHERDVRRLSSTCANKLNELELREYGDPETRTCIEQYELAFRMQTAVPDVMNIAAESKATHDAYGAKPGEGSFANNCLLARRLVSAGSASCNSSIGAGTATAPARATTSSSTCRRRAQQIDKPITALLTDLKQRGMLNETLVVWGGEFGRTSMNELRGGSKSLGRDHHPACYSMWLAGGGVKGGTTLGATDEFGYSIVKDPVGVRDLQATVLHLLGIDPYRQTYPYQRA